MNTRARPDTAQLAEALRSAVGRFVRSVRNHSDTVTTAQSEVMAQLAREGPATITALALQRGVKHQSMRLVVMRLAEQGKLDMQANPRDGRSHLVTLTPKGRTQVKLEQAARATYLADLLASRLSEEERRLLVQSIGLLDRLSEAGNGDCRESGG
jgi:DNA-binding MarR family transcriptional regulator